MPRIQIKVQNSQSESVSCDDGTTYPQNQEKPVKTKIKRKYDNDTSGEYYSLFGDSVMGHTNSDLGPVADKKEEKESVSGNKPERPHNSSQESGDARKRNRETSSDVKGTERDGEKTGSVSSAIAKDGDGSGNQGKSQKPVTAIIDMKKA